MEFSLLPMISKCVYNFKFNIMRKTSLLKVVVLCFVSCNAQQQMNQQQIPPANWVEYRIPNVCTFVIPPSMELRDNNSQFGKFHAALQESSYWEWLCNECDLFNGDYDMTFQPKGINDMDISRENPFSKYARILISFKKIPDNQLDEQTLLGFSSKDKNDLNEFLKARMEYQVECMQRVAPNYMVGQLEWNPIEIRKIDDVLCLINDFKRPGHKAQTYVHSYGFYVDNYYIEFVLTYNATDAEKYKTDFERFVNYLHFEDTFKHHKYRHNAPKNNRQTYSSVLHNIKFEYDGTEYVTEKINNAPHALLKLQSQKDDIRGITLAAFNDIDVSGYSIYHSELIESFKVEDKRMTSSRNGASNTLIESCNKKVIGNNIKTIRTIVKTTYNAYNYSMYVFIYRFINGSEIQTLNVFLSQEDYNNLSTIEQSITQGLSFIK